jgi:NAD(P) transhydrogenase subunit alpha
MDVLSVAGQHRRLQGGDDRRRQVPALLPDADDRRRHVKAARVVILGVGVAGLQAIATAKRLGAVIEASDVRPSVKEQVESLGQVHRGV